MTLSREWGFCIESINQLETLETLDTSVYPATPILSNSKFQPPPSSPNVQTWHIRHIRHVVSTHPHPPPPTTPATPTAPTSHSPSYTQCRNWNLQEIIHMNIFCPYHQLPPSLPHTPITPTPPQPLPPPPSHPPTHPPSTPTTSLNYFENVQSQYFIENSPSRCFNKSLKSLTFISFSKKSLESNNFIRFTNKSL